MNRGCRKRNLPTRFRRSPTFVRCSLAVLLLSGQGLAVAASPSEMQLLDLEQTWMKAAQQRDLDTLSAILSDDYVDINYKGVVRDKADALRASSITMQRYTQQLEEERVRIYGNTAVITGRGTLTTEDKRQYRWRFTDVLVSEGGRWRVVSSQETAETTD
jgi:ketosteroid isomerase-like protein